jgi:cytochrome c peroxidase
MAKNRVVFAGLLALGLIVFSCKKTEKITTTASNEFSTTPVSITTIFPASFGIPNLPMDNQLTEEGIYLGRLLFYDKLLSADESISCASCHSQEHAFAEPKKTSVGVYGLPVKRNATALFNMAYSRKFFWDGRHSRLANLVFEPIQAHNEMALTLPELETRLKSSDLYRNWFKKAFNTSPNIAQMSLAMEQFLLTIVSADSKFDRAGQTQSGLTQSEKDGLRLFQTLTNLQSNNNQGADCFHCHGTVLFQAQNPIAGGITNNGLDRTFEDWGHGAITGKSTDKGTFKTPSLRNIAVSGPYMHDGRFATLEEVINHYSDDIDFLSPNLSPNLANHVSGPGGLPEQMKLTAKQKLDLLNFLNTLTDTTFLRNPKYSNPF